MNKYIHTRYTLTPWSPPPSHLHPLDSSLRACVFIVDTWLTPERVAEFLEVNQSLEDPFGHECRDLPHAQTGLREERRMIGFEQGASGVNKLVHCSTSMVSACVSWQWCRKYLVASPHYNPLFHP